MRVHVSSSRHKVTLLAQQLRSSGSFKANQQGICVAELPEAQGLQVGLAEEARGSTSTGKEHVGHAN